MITESSPRRDALAEPKRRTRRGAVLTAGLAAYLFPAVSTAVNAAILPVPDLADRLAVAAWTTLGIPSALAAMAATALLHHRTPPARPAATLRAFLVAALLAAPVAAGATAVLIGNGVLDPADLQFTVSSAALGAGLAARRWARTRRHTR